MRWPLKIYTVDDFFKRNLPVLDLDSSSESLSELSESLDDESLIKPIQPIIRRNFRRHITIKNGNIQKERYVHNKD